MIHCSVSIERHAERLAARGTPLTAGQKLVLWALWAEARNPFADTPIVWAAYEHIARRTCLAVDSVRKYTSALHNAGCLRKGKSARGRGTEYTLLRPNHAPEDARRNPFDPSEAETVAAAAVEMLRGDGLVSKPKAKAARQRRKQPKISLDKIALAIEDAAGYLRKNDDTPHNLYASRKGQPKPWVARAQDFISAHDEETFRRVCERAKGREWAPTSKERLYLFEQADLVAELLAQTAPLGKLGAAFEDVVIGFVNIGASEAEARSLLAKHWPQISAMTHAELRTFAGPWKATPQDRRPPLADLFKTLQ